MKRLLVLLVSVVTLSLSTYAYAPMIDSFLGYRHILYVNYTGVDNDMTILFNSIVDWKAAAKWFNDNSTAIGGLGLGTYMYNQNNEDNEKISTSSQ